MKKVFIVLVCIQNVFVYSMIKQRIAYCKSGSTYISAIEGFVQQADCKADILVVGVHEQLKLGRYLPETPPIGDVYTTKKHIFTGDLKTKQVKSSLLCVVEPKMDKELQWSPQHHKEIYDFVYMAHRRYHRDKTISNFFEFHTPDALQEAKNDLALSYRSALLEGEKIISAKSQRSIAFKNLSVNLGFPRADAASVTIAAFIDYLKKNPKSYKFIDVYVDNYIDFLLYQDIFMKMESNK